MPILGSIGRTGCSLLVALVMIASAVTPARAAGSNLIGLFTDYGWDDPYASQLKGIIMTINPSARILDLTHSATPFNIVEASFLLDQCAEEFPPGTIFVAVVDPGVGTERTPVLVETTKGKYFIGPDNGIMTAVVAHEGFSRAWTLDKPEAYRSGDLSRTFHGRDIFAPVAARLSTGVDPDRLGTPVKILTLLSAAEPTLAGNVISAQVVHVDRFGNVILNIQQGSDLAAKLKDGTLIKIAVGKESYSAPLVKTYGDVDKGRLLLLYGGSGLLEIGVNQGSAVKELKVEPGAAIFLKP